MKKIFRVLMLAVAVSGFSVASSHAQELVVNFRPHHDPPPPPPPRPTPNHVWVAEEYDPHGGSYSYRPGYWAIPPHPRDQWIKGRWRKTYRGWLWSKGHWMY